MKQSSLQFWFRKINGATTSVQVQIQSSRFHNTKFPRRSLNKIRQTTTTMNMDFLNFSSDKRDHLTTTSGQQRDKDIHDVTVTELCDISPTVKKVVLTSPIKPVPFSFKAGQWLDLFIPNEKQVGGFSMVSSPNHLSKTGRLELAVKYSEWPPAFWIHTKCQVGLTVSIRIGGDFWLDTSTEYKLRTLANKTILFIAGGIGINPLASMIFQLDELQQDQIPGLKFLQTILLYSAKTEAELVFHEKFEKIAEKDERFKLKFFTTNIKIKNTNEFTGAKYCTAGRMKKADILQVLEFNINSGTIKDVMVYICGPPPFIKEMEGILQTVGCEKILYETWWS